MAVEFCLVMEADRFCGVPLVVVANRIRSCPVSGVLG